MWRWQSKGLSLESRKIADLRRLDSNSSEKPIELDLIFHLIQWTDASYISSYLQGLPAQAFIPPGPG